jgi:hypothetical protein
LEITIKSGELFSEDFEDFNPDGDNLPSTWVIVNNDNTPANDAEFFDKAWKVYKSTRLGTTGSIVAGATSWNAADQISANDWMILP